MLWWNRTDRLQAMTSSLMSVQDKLPICLLSDALKRGATCLLIVFSRTCWLYAVC